MSSIEKALARLIEKNKSQSNMGSVEEVPNEGPEDNVVEDDPVENFEDNAVEDIEDNTVGDVDHSDGDVETTNNLPDIDSKIKKDDLATDYVAPRRKKICHLDFDELAKSGFLTPASKNRRLSEEYRIIKRPLLMNAFGQGAAPVENGNLVAVTSAFAGEGKSFTSLNLAFSIALELDTTILLIDSDVVKCSLSKQLGLEKEKGLLDILQDTNIDVGDVIVGTDLPGLNIIPAGLEHHSPTELLASKKMGVLLSELSKRYPNRVIILDAPPLLATTEASVIMHGMGQILLVVESGRTGHDAIQSAIEHLEVDTKVVGIVLNKSRYSKGSGYYGGYYGYGNEEES